MKAHRSIRTTTLTLLLWGAISCAAAAQALGGLDAAFRPRAAPASAQPGTTAESPGLRVVVTGRQRPVVGINGRLLHVGDEVNGMRIVRIDAQGVVLVNDEGDLEHLTLAPTAVKRSAAVTPATKGVKR